MSPLPANLIQVDRVKPYRVDGERIRRMIEPFELRPRPSPSRHYTATPPPPPSNFPIRNLVATEIADNLNRHFQYRFVQ